MSDQIIGRIDEMGNRIDELESSIGELMAQVRALERVIELPPEIALVHQCLFATCSRTLPTPSPNARPWPQRAGGR
jgi:hypothetical protein